MGKKALEYTAEENQESQIISLPSLTLCNPMDYIAHQLPLSMAFSRQEYWSGLPFPSSGDPPDPGIKPVSLASPAVAGVLFNTEPPGKPHLVVQPGKHKVSKKKF